MIENIMNTEFVTIYPSNGKPFYKATRENLAIALASAYANRQALRTDNYMNRTREYDRIYKETINWFTKYVSNISERIALAETENILFQAETHFCSPPDVASAF